MKFTIPFMLIGLLVLASCDLEQATPAEDVEAPVQDILNPTEDISENDWEDILDTNWDSMAVQAWDTIRVHYTGTLDDGTVFDSSRERDQTLDFQVGAGQMIPGFDAGVVGMTEWETKTLNLTPEEAYGERDENLTEVVPREELQDFVNAGIELEVGQRLPTQIGELLIIDTDEETITLDVNHQLAGESLTFEVELVEIVR